MNTSKITQRDFELIYKVEHQLEINQRQVYQLYPFTASAKSAKYIYLGITILLLGVLTIILYVMIFPLRINLLGIIRDMMPAICLFVCYGLYQTVSTYLKINKQAREISFLYYHQKRLINEAEEALTEIHNL